VVGLDEAARRRACALFARSGQLPVVEGVVIGVPSIEASSLFVAVSPLTALRD